MASALSAGYEVMISKRRLVASGASTANVWNSSVSASSRLDRT